MVRVRQLGIGMMMVLLAVTAHAATWSGGRGPGGKNAFPEVTFPQPLSTVWKAYLGKEYVDMTPTNALVSGTTLIVGYGSRIIGLSTDTGEPRWVQDLSEAPASDLMLLDDQLLIVLPGGVLQAYNPATGESIWRRELSSGVRNGPTLTNQGFFFSTKAGTVEYVERKTGRLLNAIRLDGKVEASPIILGKAMMLCFTNGKCIKVEEGITRWEAQVPNAVVSLTPVTDGRVVVMNTTNTLYALNPSDAMTPVRWMYPCPDRLHEPVTLDGNRVYLATNSGLLHALDISTGRDVWKRTSVKMDGGKETKVEEAGLPLLAPPVAMPIVVGKHLLVRMKHGLLGVYAKDTGQLVWAYAMKAPKGAPATAQAYLGTPAIDGDQIYFAGTDGNVYHLAATAPDVDPPTFSEMMPNGSEKGFIDQKALQYVGAIIEDEGSGLQKSSITMRLDRTDLTSKMQYDAKTGYYFAALDAKTPLEPGMHRVSFTATDYRGNTGTAALNFILGTAETAERLPVTITGEFLPKHLKVKPGTIIAWTNKSGAPRTVVADQDEFSSDAQYPDGIPNSETWVWIVPADAEIGAQFYYHCRLTGQPGDGTKFGTGLVGLIEIADTAPPPPPVDTQAPPPDAGVPGDGQIAPPLMF